MLPLTKKAWRRAGYLFCQSTIEPWQTCFRALEVTLSFNRTRSIIRGKPGNVVQKDGSFTTLLCSTRRLSGHHDIGCLVSCPANGPTSPADDCVHNAFSV
ncbi:unnamed protein product [Pylaiella littoralis]